MKKLLCLVLLLSMATFCACASQSPNDSTPPITDDAGDFTPPIIDHVSETDPSTNELWKSDSLLSLGTVNGYVYENNFLGYGCNLEGWTFADEDYIAEINQLGQDTLTSDLQSLIENADVIVDMYAESKYGLQNINVQFQKLNAIYGYSPSEEDLIDLAVETFPLMLESAGYNNITVEKTRIMLDSDAHFAVAITGELDGVPIYQKEVCILCGDYAAYVTATSFLNDSLDQVLKKFYKLENNQEEMPDESGHDNTMTTSNENIYVGQKRKVIFSIPDGWGQRELSKKYEVIEAKFENKADPSTYIMYGCSDVFLDNGLARSKVNISIFDISEIAAISGISDATSEEKTIGESIYYLYLYHNNGLARLAAVTLENGFLHTITLFETTDSIQEQHRESMYELIETIIFPQD